MYAKRNYGFWQTFHWSKKPFIYGLMYTAIVATSYYYFRQAFDYDISLPWQPLSLLGISVAFYLGFKNNSSYDRTWEARKIWGGIVNSSRSLGIATTSFISGTNEHIIHQELIYRHIAWLTALRYQLRTKREWEHTSERVHGVASPVASETYLKNLDAELLHFIPQSELDTYTGKTNIATQLLHTQSKRLQQLHHEGYFDNFRHMEFFTILKSFYDEQGKSDRIKNFPFPRQYASVALWTTTLFSILMPWGVINMLSPDNLFLFWISIPLSALLIWVFFLMEKIGDYSENPFEGTYNDIPITSIARAIEIDLREMINDTHIPKALTPNADGFLM
jgi:ion channel-forming bestrophin family protein